MKTIRKIMVSLIAVVTLVVSLIIPASAATNPTFGSCASSITLYGNDANNDHRAINIKINNWKNGYKYKAYSTNTSVATVKDASVNSKSGVLFTIQAVSKGSTTVKVEMRNGSNALVQSKTINVTVSTRSISSVNNLKQTGRTKTSATVTWGLTGSNQYLTAYRVQVSEKPRFDTLIVNTTVKNSNATFNNLKPGGTYFVRVRTESNRNKVSVVTSWQSVRVTTAL